jgi:signal transduction histidine kinase
VRTEAGHVTALTTTWRGHSLVAVGIPLTTLTGSFFLLDNLDSLNHELGNIALVISLGWLVVTVGGIVLMRRQLSTALVPLERASAVVRAVAEGDTSQRIAPTASTREIHSLAENFNAMVDSLVIQMQRDANFAGDVSHELRSPLTSLTASVDRLAARRERLDDDSAQLVDSLQSDVATFSGLVTDLLELAQSDRGAAQLLLDEVNVHELMDRCVVLISRRDDISLPDITHHGDPDATCVVDRRRFERIITNLVSNAAKYANGVSALRVDSDDRWIRISVSDLGPGIPAEDAQRIFDRFYRGQSAFNRGDTTGTGLGLALVRTHMLALGGSVTVEANSPQGSVFTLVLPRGVGAH